MSVYGFLKEVAGVGLGEDSEFDQAFSSARVPSMSFASGSWPRVAQTPRASKRAGGLVAHGEDAGVVPMLGQVRCGQLEWEAVRRGR